MKTSKSTGSASAIQLKFKPGDIVLVRYSLYPYWPATVSPTHQKQYKGEYFAMRPTRGGDLVLCLWCNFINDDAGGWVRADRIILFHPAILENIRVPKGNEYCDDQEQAIKAALKFFKEMYKGEEMKMKIPQLTPDLEQSLHTGSNDAIDDDDIITDDEEHPELIDQEDSMDLDEPEDGSIPVQKKVHKEPRRPQKRKSHPSEEPGVKKRTKSSTKPKIDLLHSIDDDPEEPLARVRPKTSTESPKDLFQSIDDDPEEPCTRVRARVVQQEGTSRPSGQKRRRTCDDSAEPAKKVRKIKEELADANEEIASLKKTLREKERTLAQLTADGTGVAFVMPPLRPKLSEPLPESETYRSTPIGSTKTGSLMERLSKGYESFQEAAEGVIEARAELEKTTETIKKLYHEACLKLSAAEEDASKMEIEFVSNLSEILQADIQVQDLQQRRSGKVILAILKKCKDMSAISRFCKAICSSWKSQISDYEKANADRLAQEGFRDAKPSPDKKLER